MTDWTKRVDKLFPPPDGESAVRHRTGTVIAVNADGTLDIDLGGVTVSNVATIHTAPVGAVVQVLAWKGDLLVLGAVDVGLWQSWTPSLTNLTLGNGTQVARYVQMGRTTHIRYALLLGSSSSVGTNPAVSLPVQAASDYPDFYNIGEAFLRDVTGSIFKGIARFSGASRTVAQVLASQVSGAHIINAGITSTVPFTWTTSDVLAFSATYESI